MDNTTLNPGVGGDVIASEAVGSAKLAVSKIRLGAAGVDGGDVTPSNPFPVVFAASTYTLNGQRTFAIVDRGAIAILETMVDTACAMLIRLRG